MTRDQDFKRLVRARMRETGENYALARSHFENASREGKQRAAAPGEHGALDPVTSERIATMFARHGFEVAGRYNDPYVRSAGELLVMKRRG